MKHLIIILIFSSFQSLLAETPAELNALRTLREKEVKKIDIIYVNALKKLKTKFTKRGDLKNALLIEEEITQYTKTKIRQYVSETKGSYNTTYTFNIEDLGKNSFVNFWASYDDNKGSTFGNVYLLDEKGKKVLIHKWKTSDFTISANSAKSFEDLKPISVDVKDLVKKTGKYRVQFEYTSGNKGLAILRVSMDIHK